MHAQPIKSRLRKRVAPRWLPVMLSVVTVIFVFSAETIKRRYVCYSFFDVGH